MLPDRKTLKNQKLVENAIIEKLKCDILSNFQTMCDAVWKIHMLLQMQFRVNFFGCSRLIQNKGQLMQFLLLHLLTLLVQFLDLFPSNLSHVSELFKNT